MRNYKILGLNPQIQKYIENKIRSKSLNLKKIDYIENLLGSTTNSSPLNNS